MQEQTSQRTDDLKRLVLAKKKLRSQQLKLAYDPSNLDSRPTPTQAQALADLADCTAQDVRGGNQSGKSQYGSKNVAYFCGRDHPNVDIEKLWSGVPILVLVLCRTSTHYEEHWEKRIRPFFEPGTYRETRVGGVLKTVRFTNGSKIIFFSYENPYEAADRIQSFTAHLIWIDELCDYLPLYTEAERRIQRFGGRLLITYTPIKPNPEVRRYIESPSPYKRSYVFDAFDNPAYNETAKLQIMASLNQLPASERARHIGIRVRGDWADAEGAVISFDSNLHGAALPDHYNPKSWRHHETVDPAASGKCGLMICAEEPTTGTWYVILAKYLDGEAPTDLLDKVELETAGFNITHRTSDPNAAWFIKEAGKRKRYYGGVEKDNRKEDLIKNVSEALKAGWLKVVEDQCELLTDEFGSARWSDTQPGKIVNSTKYHLFDCLQYFVDLRPKFIPHNNAPDVLVLLDLANQQRKKNLAIRETRAAKRKASRLRPAFKIRRR